MASEDVVGNSLNYDENSWDRQSRCYQKVLRFQMRLTEICSSSICPLRMGNYDKSAAAQISAVLGTRERVDSQRVV